MEGSHVISGNFYFIFFSFERKGGCSILTDMDKSSDFINERELIYFPLSARKFIWTNNSKLPSVTIYHEQT